MLAKFDTADSRTRRSRIDANHARLSGKAHCGIGGALAMERITYRFPAFRRMLKTNVILRFH